MHSLVGLDPVQLWESVRPYALGALGRYGPDLIRAGVLRLKERVGQDPAPAQLATQTNARSYTVALGAVLDGLHARGQLSEDDLARAIGSPAIARVLEQAVLTASVTADGDVHRDLAALVGARLMAADDSQIAMLLRDATARLDSLNARHLRTLAFIYFVKFADAPANDETADPGAQLESLLAWVERRAAVFGRPAFTLTEAAYLEGAHVLKLRLREAVTTPSEFTVSKLRARIAWFDGVVDRGAPSVGAEWLEQATREAWDFASAYGVAPTPVGQVLGFVAYCRLVGEEPDFRKPATDIFPQAPVP
jgi:hypothetical protein